MLLHCIFSKYEVCLLSICLYIHFHCVYLLMGTVCHYFFFLALKVPVHSWPFSPLVYTPGIQSCGVPLLSASQLLNELVCFVVLLINNCVVHCIIILEPLHINSILICCDLCYFLIGLGSEFVFLCLSLHFTF